MDTKSDRYGYVRKTGAIGVCTKAIAVSGSTRGKGALGSSSVPTAGLARRAKIEGNESAKYERLEKRSLKGLKGGGTEKELRDGHNTRGSMSHMNKAPGLKTPKAAAVKPVYNATTNPIRAARQTNRANLSAAKATGDKAVVKATRVDNKATMGGAKIMRQERNDAGLRKSDRLAGRTARKTARKGLGALV